MFYVLTHQDYDDEFLIYKENHILHMGCDSFIRNDCLFDTTGDSIAEKNPFFCELTGIYWIWKNGEEYPCESISIEHYRRLFMLEKTSEKWIFPDGKAIEHLLNTYDIILPEPIAIEEKNIEEQYRRWHRGQDLDLLRESLREMYPNDIYAFERVMRGNIIRPYNMLMCRKKLFDSYCGWLFPLLFELEKRIDIATIEDPYQRRVFGFMAERLLNVWVEARKLHYLELPVIKTGL